MRKFTHVAMCEEVTVYTVGDSFSSFSALADHERISAFERNSVIDYPCIHEVKPDYKSMPMGKMANQQ